MTNLVAGLGLLAAFIALMVLHNLPNEMDRIKASLAVGMGFLGTALLIYLCGISLAVLDFANV